MIFGSLLSGNQIHWIEYKVWDFMNIGLCITCPYILKL